MHELLKKISSYNIFNNLLPGVLFVLILDYFTKYSLIQQNIILGAFLYYFVGLVVSRVGSLLIEPLFKLLSIIKFSNYEDFIKASKEDGKIELLNEVNNMYRTFCSMFLILLILKVYEKIEIKFNLSDWNYYICIISLFLLFTISYRKQTSFISKRININKK